jgi:hypothetical protein
MTGYFRCIQVVLAITNSQMISNTPTYVHLTWMIMESSIYITLKLSISRF